MKTKTDVHATKHVPVLVLNFGNFGSSGDFGNGFP